MDVLQYNGRRIARVDLTPMVDLGFLLITFFIFSSTLSETKAMQLLMPEDSADSMHVPESSSIQLVVYPGQVIAYPGNEMEKWQSFDLQSPLAFRNYLQQKQQSLNSTFNKTTTLFISIKPVDECTLSQIIDVLDEMTICDIKSYALCTLSKQELQRLDILIASSP